MIVNDVSIDAFCLAYLEAALWTMTDDDGNECDGYSVRDFSFSALQKALDVCTLFQTQNESDLEPISDEQAGHDLWLTVNRHGCGYWERDIPGCDRLTQAAHRIKETGVELGDDSLLHFYG